MDMSFSVLVTREEYMTFAAQTQRARRRAAGFSFTALLGGLLTILSIGGLFFGSYIDLSPFSAGCLLVFALVLLLYDECVAPVVSRAVAAREFDENADLRMATVYTFTSTDMQIRNGRLQGTLPLAFVTAWNCTVQGFTLHFGRELAVVLPARLMSEAQQTTLREWLETRIEAAHE